VLGGVKCVFGGLQGSAGSVQARDQAVTRSHGHTASGARPTRHAAFFRTRRLPLHRYCAVIMGSGLAVGACTSTTTARFQPARGSW
jgi:hypothetical protein